MRRMLERRVVVTGVGLVTPLGIGVEKNWDALMAGRSGIGPITRFDASEFPARVAGEVNDFVPEDWIEKRDVKKMDPFIQYAVASADQAMKQSGFQVTEENADQVGVLVGVGIGGLCTIEEYGYLDAAITGGSEAAITSLGVGGFVAMRALSTRSNDAPEKASRPFDKNRDGFVMAEGSAALILEERDAAIARGANILAEVCGYAANSDAYHITSPSPEGRGAAKCMRMCLEDSDLDPNEVDYINAHGTSTEQGDLAETQAVKRVFGERAAKVAISSTKSMTGHTLGAAGAIESVYTVLAIERGMLPPTINQEFPDPECDLDYVPNRPRAAKIRIALNNSFGFGGTNTTLAFRPANLS